MEKFCLDLSNALAKEHDVLLLADPNFKRYVDNRVEFIELDVEKSRNNLLFLWKIRKIIKSFAPDIVHVHKQNTIHILKQLFLDIPFVATKHDTQNKKAFHGLKYSISISDAMKKTIKAKNIYKVYNGVPYVAPKKITMPNTFNIVAVGGLRKVKGYENLIQSVSKLSFDFHLTIIGEGNECGTLEQLIEDTSLTQKVSLIGFKDNVQDYLHSADLQIISSSSEGFSLSMVEGIFYAPLLISTKVSGCTEILSDELLFDIAELKEKIEDIYEYYDQYKEQFNMIKMKNKAQLTMDACMKNHEKVYQKIINNNQKDILVKQFKKNHKKKDSK
jgi:glycosyltransferase involved in cell wall biosynthesis